MKKGYELNSIFSKSVLNDLLDNGKSNKLDSVFEKYDGENVQNDQEKFEYLYHILNSKYRNEYFYKNTLFNKQVLGTHSLKTTNAITELPISNSIADFIMINNEGHVIEIKTELDNLERLSNQIKDYYKAFDRVTILCDEKHLSSIEKKYQRSTVGISILTKKGTIKKIKQAEINRQYLNHLAIYKTLRKSERKEMVKSFYEKIPKFKQVEEYEKNYDLLKDIDINKVYDYYIEIMRKRNKIKDGDIELFKSIPYELKAAVFFSKINSKNYYKLVQILEGGK